MKAYKQVDETDEMMKFYNNADMLFPMEMPQSVQFKPNVF